MTDVVDTTQRANCWSITINNPTDSDLNPPLPGGWRCEGQLEKGEECGTVHYQAMLTTPQVRFAAVKKMFPRAKILVARNRNALQKYVHKEDTRLSEVPTIVSQIPNCFDYQADIAEDWDDTEFARRTAEWHNKLPDTKLTIDDVALEYVDYLVSEDIKRGRRGVEWVGINPMWRSSWKKFWPAILARSRIVHDAQPANEIIPPQTEDRQTDN